MVHQIKIKVNGIVDIAQIDEVQGNYTFIYKDITIRASEDPAMGYFAQLREIREQLEKMDIVLMINASRIDVWSRTYHRCNILEMGKPATKYIDNVFDEPEQPELVGTVKEQREYNIRWADSLKKLPPPYLTEVISWSQHPDKSNFYHRSRDGKTIFLIMNLCEADVAFTLIDGYNVVDLSELPESWTLVERP